MPANNDEFQRAFVEFLGDRLTEAMTLSQLAEHFAVSRHTMRRILTSLDGVVRVRSLIRVPWRHMPPKYVLALFRELGVLSPEIVGQICAQLQRDSCAAA